MSEALPTARLFENNTANKSYTELVHQAINHNYNWLAQEADSTDDAIAWAGEAVGRARERYAAELAMRHVHVMLPFKSGSKINVGKKAKSNKDKQQLQDENVQFAYEVALGMFIRAQQAQVQEAHGPVTTTQQQDELDRIQREVVVDSLYGSHPEAEEGYDGELFLLNDAVRRQRLQKTGFYEVDQYGQLSEKQGGSILARKTRNFRKNMYRKWNGWTEQGGVKGNAKKAATIGLGGVALTAALGLGFGWAGAAGGLVAGRIAKARAMTRIHNQANGLLANKEATAIMQKYNAERQAHFVAPQFPAPNSLAASGLNRVLHEDFTDEANRQARKNKLRVALGAASLAGTVIVAEHILPEDVQAVIPKALGLHKVHEHINGDHHNGGNGRHNGSSNQGSGKSSGSSGSQQPESTKKPGGSGHRSHNQPPRPKFTVSENQINGRYVSTVYEQEYGNVHSGFANMLMAAHHAMAQGELIKVQPDASDPDTFWYKVTKKGAKKIARAAAGSTRTEDVMRVLAKNGGAVKVTG
jgi:hypothetical protein